MKRFLMTLLAAGLPMLASAQAYPSKPVRLIVPFPAGATTDTVARVVGQAAAALLGQPIVIENKPGAVLSGRRDHQQGHTGMCFFWINFIDDIKRIGDIGSAPTGTMFGHLKITAGC